MIVLLSGMLASRRKQHKAAAGERIARNRFFSDPELEAAVLDLEAGNWALYRTLLESRPVPPRGEVHNSTASIDIFREWAAEDDSCIAHSQLAAAHVRDGWQARGRGRSETVSEEAWAIFFGQLHLAEASCRTAIERDPTLDFPWVHLITSARGLSHSKDELRYRFAQAQERRPFARDTCDQMLQGLCEKWSGSHEQMFEFARWVDAESPPGSTARGAIGQAHQEMHILDSGWIKRPAVQTELTDSLNAFMDAIPSEPDQLDAGQLAVIGDLLVMLRAASKEQAQVMTEAIRRLDDRPVSGWQYYLGYQGFRKSKLMWGSSLAKFR